MTQTPAELVPPERARTGGMVLLQRVVMAWFLALIIAVPLSQLAWQLARKEPVQELELFHRFPTLERLTAYERALEDNCRCAELVRERLQWLALLALRTGNQKALVGPDGALFYQPSVEAALRPGFMAEPSAQGHPLAAIEAFHRTLARRGVQLVVLAVPGKEAIYPEWLRPDYDLRRGPAVNRDMARFMGELNARGITAIDPTELLWTSKGLGRLYLRNDTHWTPLGLRIVADEVARRLPPLPPNDRALMLQRAPQTAPGDLLEMLKLPPWPTPLPPDQVIIERVLDAETGAPLEMDQESPVLVLGDSFTNIYSVADMGWGDHAGLAEQLGYRLKRAVDVIAMNDGGVNRTRGTLARRPEPLAGKRIVVWQFAARDLVVSNGQWETIEIGRSK